MSTIADLLRARAAERPDAPFLIDAATGQERPYAAVLLQARRWAGFYRARGLGVGARVAVVLPNGLDFAELYLGAALAGLTLCPYNPAFTDIELTALMARFGAQILLTTAHRAEGLAETGLPVFTVGATGQLPAGLPEPLDPEPPSPQTLFVLIMTSGTSGGVKACRLNQGNLVWSSRATVEAYGQTPESRYLTPLPLFHINAQVIGVLAALQAGSAVAIGSRLPAAKLWEAAERCRATGMSAVPAILYDLLDSPAEPPATLRYVVTSSASLPAAYRTRFEERFGIPLLSSYGLSEAGCFVSYGRRSPLSPPEAVGLPHGCEVRLEREEIVVRGPGVFEGYDGDPEATARALRAGWLYTGDRGRIDEQGFLYVDGRLKEMINRGGEKIAPDAVEAILRPCPDLAEVSVFGVPDQRLGEEVAAAVVVREGCDPSDDDLWDYCVGRLAEFEMPKTWLRLAALPKGGTGKVLRRKLKEIWQHAR